MGKDEMIETKRKSLILPWLLIVLAVATILITALFFFDIESRRAYSDPGNLSSAVLILGILIAAPLLIIGVYFVGRNTRFNDRIDEFSPSRKLGKLDRLDMPSSAPMDDQSNPMSNDEPIVELSSAEKKEVRKEMHGEEELEAICPICGNVVTLDDPICPHCGAEFEEEEVEEVELEEMPEASEAEEKKKEEITEAEEMGMVMHCSNCGKRLDGGKFCRYCGAETG